MNMFGVATGLFLYFSNTEVLAKFVISVALLLAVVKIVISHFLLN